MVKQEPAAAEAPNKAAGSAAATGCRAAVSLAALAMQDSRPDAWLQALCNQHNAAESILSAQPLEAGHRHSSGGSEQSLARHTSFAQHLTAMPLEDLGNLDLSQEQTLSEFSGPGHNTVLSAVTNCQAPTGSTTVPSAIAACQAATGVPAWTGSNSTVRLELAPGHSAVAACQAVSGATGAPTWAGSSPAVRLQHSTEHNRQSNPVASAPMWLGTSTAVEPQQVKWAPSSSAEVSEHVSNDPLQDVLSWQLPPLQENKPALSSFEQAMAFMQDDSQAYSAGPSALYQQHLGLPHMTPSTFGAAMPVMSGGCTLPNTRPTPYTNFAQYSTPSSQTPQFPCMSAAAQQAYEADNTALRLSVKLFNCTPAQLPPTLRERVTGWLGSTPTDLEGFIRPGCVHLTVQLTVPVAKASGGCNQAPSVSQAVGHLLASPQEEEVWHSSTMLVQLGNEAAVVHEGSPLRFWSVESQAEGEESNQEHGQQQQQQQGQQSACCSEGAIASSMLPSLSLTEPAVLVAGHSQQQQVRVAGLNMGHDCKVLCRAGGKHLEVQVAAVAGSDVAASMLEV